MLLVVSFFFFFFQAEDGIRDRDVTGVQTCALPICLALEDRFHAALAGVAVPRGQAGRLSYVSEFVEQAKASGLIQQEIGRASCRERVEISGVGGAVKKKRR